jgi:hypothetical protein
MATGLPSFVAEITSQANVRPRFGHLLTMRYEDSGNVWFEAVHVQANDVRARTKQRRAFGAGDLVGRRRLARLLPLCIYIARAISVQFRLIKEACYGLCDAGGE